MCWFRLLTKLMPNGQPIYKHTLMHNIIKYLIVIEIGFSLKTYFTSFLLVYYLQFEGLVQQSPICNGCHLSDVFSQGHISLSTHVAAIVDLLFHITEMWVDNILSAIAALCYFLFISKGLLFATIHDNIWQLLQMDLEFNV